MSSAKALYQLQEIDLKILRNSKRLGEIDLTLSDSKIVQVAQKAVQIAENALKPLRTKAKDLELEMQTNNTKRQTTDARLYSGMVKNPKELQEMQQEIVALKNRNDQLEEQLLEFMMSIEEAEAVLEEKQNHLQSITHEWESQHTDLLQEKTLLQTENNNLNKNRISIVQNIDPKDLKVYEGLRTKKANKPISIMQGRSCTICGIEQTLAIQKEVIRGQSLINCVNCERILVDIH